MYHIRLQRESLNRNELRTPAFLKLQESFESSHLNQSPKQSGSFCKVASWYLSFMTIFFIALGVQ